jgi:hypothetical protein
MSTSVTHRHVVRTEFEGPLPKSLTRSLTLGLLLRLGLLLCFEGDLGDAASRTQDTLVWLSHPYPLFGSTTWGPLNYLLPAAAIKLAGGEAFWSVRVLYVLIGTASIGLLYGAVAQILDRESGAIAALLLAVNPYHITHSANGATSEIPAIAFGLLGLAAVVRYRRTAAIGWLLVAALAGNLGSLVRYDGVVWSASLGLVLLLPAPPGLPPVAPGRRWAAAVGYGVLALMASLSLVWYWQRTTGDPLFGLSRVNVNVHQFFDQGAYAGRSMLLLQSYGLVFYLLSGLVILSPLVWGAAASGLWRSIRERCAWELVVPMAIVTVFLTIQTLRHTLTPHFRFALILSVLLLAFAATGLGVLRDRWPILRGAMGGWALAASVVATYAVIGVISVGRFGVLTRQLIWISPVRRGAYNSRPLVHWMRDHLRPGERVLVLPCVYSPYLVLAGADLTERGVLDIVSTYRDDTHALTRVELGEIVTQKLPGTTYVLGETACREVGWVDGPGPDVLTPRADGSATVANDPVPWTSAMTSGTLRLYRRMGST